MDIQINDRLTARCTQLNRLIISCSSFLSTAPDGFLKIKTRGDSHYYYAVRMVDGKCKVSYLGNKVTAEVRALAQKTYLQRLINAAKEELDNTERFIDHTPQTTVENIYSQLSDTRKALIKPYALSDEEFAKRWQEQKYTPKKFREGTPVYMTMKGERVRSKSEQLIADRLYMNNIPYKYECPLQVGEFVIYPDFTILKMSTREDVYLEHCGRMGDEQYADDAVSRFNNYALNGVTPGKRLFTLYETRNIPLDTRVLDQMIATVFR